MLMHLGVKMEISDDESIVINRLRRLVMHHGYPDKLEVDQADLEVWENIARRYEAIGIPASYTNEHGLLFQGVGLVGRSIQGDGQRVPSGGSQGTQDAAAAGADPSGEAQQSPTEGG